ncbi:MAG: UDP-Glc:alpha-D-GlcNAc-diphosphoundecaprenol beta-1,3-glucosyltransferase WfgD [Syntrophorhabdus sp. PtaU1.Bin002]|nr:MAG: UDP-Glc:alpha-D-GlcNAc-diphosphoundecaprenol beta-1,3-glucosyltransferase WfgD [Syntrophorhabdus sp. PtaU1.Bin002]
MLSLTIVAPYSPEPFFAKTMSSLVDSGLVEDAVIVSEKPVDSKIPRSRLLVPGPLSSQETLMRILHDVRTDYLLFVAEGRHISVEPGALEKILTVAETTQAGLVYTDFYDVTGRSRVLHSLNDYQLGSVRDDFDFGSMIIFSVSALRRALTTYGPTPPVKHAGLYDLRLKVSIDHPVHHLGEPLYSAMEPDNPAGAEGGIFAYVDPRHVDSQKEMEAVFADYLKKIGAYLPSRGLKAVDHKTQPFPVEASVIIPVRNRKRTVADAVQSALSQETDFPFNIIVVDNHSTDGTTAILSCLSEEFTALKHIVPERTDLAIGGCWNEALYSQACGRYAVQLDSDDLYGSTHTLRRIVDMLRQGYAMVVGSYTIVNFDLEEIPPGFIDHREWTDENGHNNALRVNGLGAPRAFDTQVIRGIGFLNVSYGEDYAVALRICREYRIGRIYESLYLCRRWSDNTDASLSIEGTNRNNAFKDTIRTNEIMARKTINGGA